MNNLKVMRLITCIAFLFLMNINSYSQSIDTVYFTYVSVQSYEISHSSIKKEINPDAKAYQGSYHFGESEGESQLEILHSNGKLYARTVYSEWRQNGWVGVIERLPIVYSKGAVWVDEYLYTLYKCVKTAPYTLDKGTKGLVSFVIVDNVDENTVKQEEQFNPDTKGLKKAPGTYPETSFVKLSDNDLKSYSKSELKIMRNEIFARHGYIFKKGGEMDNYFSRLNWYKSVTKKVSVNLSDIEQYNVNLILRTERIS